jgi:hypothetical protein
MLGATVVAGFPVVIEHAQGTERLGGVLPADYGFIRRTGSAESRYQQMDTFIGGGGSKHFIVDSFEPDSGRFDEHKIFLNYESAAAAMRDFRAYYSGYSTVPGYLGKGPERRVGWATQVSRATLESWLASGTFNTPWRDARDTKYVPAAKRSEERCSLCKYFNAGGTCSNNDVLRDPKVPEDSAGQKYVAAGGWCTEFKVMGVLSRDSEGASAVN